MYKLSKEEFLKIEVCEQMERAHNIPHFQWRWIYDCNNGNIPDSPEEDYQLYLRWHEIYTSPLAKALREE